MKLKLFLVISAIVAVIYAVLNPFMSGNPATVQTWSILVVLGTILPAVIALIAQRDGFKTFLSDYLSIKHTNWRRAIWFTVVTAIILPALSTLLTFVLGNVMHIEIFGSITSNFTTNLFGVFTFTGSTVSDVIIAVAAEMLYLLIIGSIAGIVNCVFEEIAWRGFMVKYLKCSEAVAGVLTGLVWTLWWLAMTYAHCDVTTIVMTFIINIALSYYLVTVAQRTGSVWTCAMIRGIFSFGTVAVCSIPAPGLGQRLITLTVVLVLIAITSRIKSRQ